ncbi:MAG TPA: hypothetical protein VFM76_03885, partial [Methylophaga sp.]|nr:hypothetical protein [Methylophaga sp.]
MQAVSSTNSIGVSWGAVFAGAVASAAMALILLILGFGLGLSVISPWADAGISAAAIGISTIAWLTLTQIIASGLGGYLAGRLRVKWTDLHHDEVYFRDTAHGLVSWAVSTLIAAVLVTCSIGFALSTGANAAAKITGGVAASVVSELGEMNPGTSEYLIDTLLRSDNSADAANNADIRRELSNILFRDLMNSDISNADIEYAAGLIAGYTGVSQQQAEVRITQIIERARQAKVDAEVATMEAVEAARESAAYTALWLFISLLCGAFT